MFRRNFMVLLSACCIDSQPSGTVGRVGLDLLSVGNLGFRGRIRFPPLRDWRGGARWEPGEARKNKQGRWARPLRKVMVPIVAPKESEGAKPGTQRKN